MDREIAIVKWNDSDFELLVFIYLICICFNGSVFQYCIKNYTF